MARSNSSSSNFAKAVKSSKQQIYGVIALSNIPAFADQKHVHNLWVTQSNCYTCKLKELKLSLTVAVELHSIQLPKVQEILI